MGLDWKPSDRLENKAGPEPLGSYSGRFVGLTLVLLSIGLLVGYGIAVRLSLTSAFQKQLIALCLGAAGAIFVYFLPFKWIRKASPFAALAGLILLAAVLWWGTRVNGATRWFRFGGVQFQPSDFAKLSMILGLAWYCSLNQGKMRRVIDGLVVPGLFVFLHAILLILEPDFGTAALFVGIGFYLIILSGARWPLLVPFAVLAGIFALVFLYHDEVRWARILAYLRPMEFRDTTGYQTYASQVALGSGGVLGKGLGRGTEIFYVPECQHDFVFAIIGHELGFVGAVAVAWAFFFWVLTGLKIAWLTKDRFGALLANGIVTLLGAQAFLNMMVVSGLFFNKGIPLPFISLGGSSLMTALVMTGLVVRVAKETWSSLLKAEEVGQDQWQPVPIDL